MYKEIINFHTDKRPNIPGWCSTELAWLLNDLVGKMPADQKYLEIGTFCGKSLCAALYNNTTQAFVIDPMDLVTGIGTTLELWSKNIEPFCDRVILANMRAESPTIPSNLHKNIGVFFYDGNHDSGHTYEALNKYVPFMVSNSILIVDDYNIDGGNMQTPYPGHKIDELKPVKTDTDRWLEENKDMVGLITITNWLNGQAIIEINKC